MSPRPSAFLAAAALLAAGAGCRHCGDRCNDRPFGLTSNTRKQADCRLVGSGGRPAVTEGCFDAVTGQPVPCPPMPAVPGGTPALPGVAPPNELPFPSPADVIPRPNVPFAPATPAPPGEGVGRDRGPTGKTTGKP